MGYVLSSVVRWLSRASALLARIETSKLQKQFLLLKVFLELVVSIRPSSPLRFAQDYSTTKFL